MRGIQCKTEKKSVHTLTEESAFVSQRTPRKTIPVPRNNELSAWGEDKYQKLPHKPHGRSQGLQLSRRYRLKPITLSHRASPVPTHFRRLPKVSLTPTIELSRKEPSLHPISESRVDQYKRTSAYAKIMYSLNFSAAIKNAASFTRQRIN